MIRDDAQHKETRRVSEGPASPFFFRLLRLRLLLKQALIILSMAAHLANATHASEPKSPPNVIVSDDFEQWSWEPITFSMRQSGKKRLKAGKRLPFEHRGPLFRVAKGFLQSGRMVEGDEAFKGRSVLLEDCQIGLHGRYSKLIEPGKTYRYEVSLKGKGTFHFRAWVGANNPTTGEFRWLGFPDLIKIEATKSWKTHAGEFQLPEFDTATFKLPAKTSGAIVVQEGHQIVVDNFAISLLATH